MTVVARNHRTATGSAEVDLIAWDADVLVFVEVKSRSSADFGPPDRAIDNDKQRRLVHAALDYVRRACDPSPKLRFDIVNVIFSNPPVVTHHRDAFTLVSAGCQN
jgi:putative endonuclease